MTTCCNEREALVRQQTDLVASLEADLAILIAEGDEYHAEGFRQDIEAAKSLARLLHTHQPPIHD